MMLTKEQRLAEVADLHKAQRLLVRMQGGDASAWRESREFLQEIADCEGGITLLVAGVVGVMKHVERGEK